MADRRGEYSTLEVVEHPSHDTNKMVVQDHNDLPQVVSPSHGQYKPPEDHGGYYAAQGAGGHSPYQQSAYTHSAYPYQDNEHGAGAPHLGNEKPAGKRICGLAAKTFWIIAAIVTILVIGAVVGAAVGATVGQKKGDGSTPPETVLSVDSRVAAVNWTDSQQLSHYAVFTQDKSNSLLVSLWDSGNKTWNPLNISKILSDGGSPITVKPGSSLAGAVTGDPYKFQLNVYYLTPSNGIGEIITVDTTFKAWSSGDLNQQSPKVAASNSQLTACWQRCDNFCSNEVLVMYEDGNNNIALLNSSDWTRTLAVDNGNKLDSGAAMAVFPFIFNGGRNGSFPGELRYYANTGGEVHEWLHNTERRWAFGRQLSQVTTSPPPQLAASPFGGWQQILMVQRSTDGSVVGNRWDTRNWNTNQRLNLQGGPSSASFDYIAMNNDGRFYGTIKGEIHEYSWGISDPYTFLYVGTVRVS